MDVPSPKSNSTVLQKVPLACEEVFYRRDKTAYLRRVLVGSGGQGVLLGASTTNGRKADEAHRTKRWDGDSSNLPEYFTALVVPRNIRHSNPRRESSF